MSSEFRPFSEYKLCEYRRYGTVGQWFAVERDRVIEQLQDALRKESDKVERWQDMHGERVQERDAFKARVEELEDQLSKALAHSDCKYGYDKEEGE